MWMKKIRVQTWIINGDKWPAVLGTFTLSYKWLVGFFPELEKSIHQCLLIELQTCSHKGRYEGGAKRKKDGNTRVLWKMTQWVAGKATATGSFSGVLRTKSAEGPLTGGPGQLVQTRQTTKLLSAPRTLCSDPRPVHICMPIWIQQPFPMRNDVLWLYSGCGDTKDIYS